MPSFPRIFILSCVLVFCAASPVFPQTLQDYKHWAEKYEEENQYLGAEQTYLEGLHNFPGDAGLYEGLGWLYRKLMKYGKAEEAFKHGLELEPENKDLHYGLGVVYHEAGTYGLAQREFERCLTLEPDAADVCSSLGILYRDQEMYEKAEEYLTRAIKLDPAYAMAYNNLGTLFQHKGELEKAAVHFREALAVGGEDSLAGVYAHVNLSGLYSTSHDFEKAKEEIGNLQGHPVEQAIALRNLAVGYEERRMYVKAVRALEDALELMPDYADAQLSLVTVYYAQKDYPRALAAVRRLYSLVPQDPRVPYWESLIAVETGDFKTACERSVRALALASGSTQLDPVYIYGNYGEALLKLKKPKEAAECYAKALALDKDNTYCLDKLGDIYASQKRYAEAAAMYEKILELRPGGEESILSGKDIIFCKLCPLYMKLRRYDQAIDVALRLRKMNAHDSMVYGCLIDAYRARGEKARAEEVMAQACAIWPDFRRQHAGGWWSRYARQAARPLGAAGFFAVAALTLFGARKRPPLPALIAAVALAAALAIAGIALLLRIV